jgi:hypothetical protein
MTDSLKFNNDYEYPKKIENTKIINSHNKFHKLIYGEENRNKFLASSEDKIKYKEIYNELINDHIIDSQKYKYTPEYYVYYKYIPINKPIENSNINDMIKENLIEKSNTFFKKTQIHDKITLKVNFKNYNTFGTFLDGALSYLYDNSIDLLKYILDCKEPEIHDLINEKKINTNENLIREIFNEQLDKIKLILDEKYKNIRANTVIYNNSLKAYGNPDLISDDCVIDIKISKNNDLFRKENYLQLISYGVLLNKNKICFYDIEKGYIYEGELKNIENIRKKFYSKFMNSYEEKEYYNYLNARNIRKLNKNKL